MNVKYIITVRLEAERFLRKLSVLEDTEEFKDSVGNLPKRLPESAAAKRSSMDLSRALSDLRK